MTKNALLGVGKGVHAEIGPPQAPISTFSPFSAFFALFSHFFVPKRTKYDVFDTEKLQIEGKRREKGKKSEKMAVLGAKDRKMQKKRHLLASFVETFREGFEKSFIARCPGGGGPGKTGTLRLSG